MPRCGSAVEGVPAAPLGPMTPQPLANLTCGDGGTGGGGGKGGPNEGGFTQEGMTRGGVRDLNEWVSTQEGVLRGASGRTTRAEGFETVLSPSDFEVGGGRGEGNAYRWVRERKRSPEGPDRPRTGHQGWDASPTKGDVTPDHDSKLSSLPSETALAVPPSRLQPASGKRHRSPCLVDQQKRHATRGLSVANRGSFLLRHAPCARAPAQP